MVRPTRFVLALCLLVAATVVPAGSASADHANVLGHWARSRNGFGAPHVCLDGVIDPNLVQTALNIWTSDGYPSGWWFNVCATGGPMYYVHYDGTRSTCTAYTQDQWDANRHNYRVDTWINDQGCSSTPIRQGLMVHEVGHSLGLGHTAVSGCVMDPVVNVEYPCQHDIDAVAQTYAHAI